MTSATHQATPVQSSPFVRIVRNLADVALLVAFIIGVSVAFEVYALPLGQPWATLVPLWGQPLAVVAFIWLLLRLRGHRLATIGLGRKPLVSTLLQALAFAAALFAISYVTEAMGFTRDFNSIRVNLEGQPLNLFFFVVYAFIGAGLYEETTFRGLTLDRVARVFGETPIAWVIAVIVQGALFGLAHVHQGEYGMLYTGALGTLFACVLFLNGRNLWALVLGHGLYDATRFVYLYCLWTYGG
jgi:membrane protease YdiL (CAAX protease family)